MSHLDDLEIRENSIREVEQLGLLNSQIDYAKDQTQYFAKTLADVSKIDAVADLKKLPLVRKSDLIEQQTTQNPFAGMNATNLSLMKNLFLSPGPIAEPFGRIVNEHRLARAMTTAGFTNQDRVLNCFSYHHTPAGLMFESGAEKIGCPVYPGGIGQRDDQIKAIIAYGLTAYVGTPDFLKLIIERADEIGADISSIKRGLVSGGPFFPALKDFYNSRNIDVVECYATADLGLIAYQDEADGLVIDEEVIVEIVTPGTGDVVEDGAVGEVVVTLLSNKTYPLIRFATGDLSAVLIDVQNSSRTNKRLKGWMGRADQTCKIKGMFVHPKQVAEIVTKANITKARLSVSLIDGRDIATLTYEGDVAEELLVQTIKDVTKISAIVKLVAPNTLPNDGIIIEDKRDYS